MGTLSLNAATDDLHEAMAAAIRATNAFTAIYDAATTADPIAVRKRIEEALVMIQMAHDHWGTDAGLNLLMSGERSLKFALGAENDG